MSVRNLRWVALSLTLGLPNLGCQSRDSSPAPSPGVAAASKAPAKTKPATNQWRRAPTAEPDPAAKALYRRAVDLTVAGARDEARALFDQITKDYPESRFAKRLQGGASTAAVAGLLGLVGAAAIPLLRDSANTTE